MALLILNDEVQKNSNGFYPTNSRGQFERLTENLVLHNHDQKQLTGNGDIKPFCKKKFDLLEVYRSYLIR